jgi:hypothetical protein
MDLPAPPREYEFRKFYPDLFLIGILMVAASIFVLIGFHRVSPYILNASTWDYWFESDPPAAVDQMLHRFGDHARTSHHPLFSILVSTPLYVLRKGMHLGAEAAIGVLLTIVAAIWIAAFFVCLRFLGLRRLDSLVFSCLAATSASVVFWFPVPESFGLGALSIILALTATAFSERNPDTPLWVYLLFSTMTLCFTSTNWMVGLAMLFVLLGWRKAIPLSLMGGSIVSILWCIQKVIFPLAGSPINIWTSDETDYLFNKSSLGIYAKIYSFFSHSIILPNVGNPYGYRLSVQGMLPGSGGYLASAGVTVWVALLVLAGWSAFQLKGSKTVTVLLLAILGQFVLSMVFGVETFLYSAHFGPLLVLFCALSGLTSARRLAVPLGVMLVIVAAVNNFQKFDAAADGLKARYEDEYRFTDRTLELTDPNALIICGIRADGAIGMAGKTSWPPSKKPVGEILLEYDADAGLFIFDDLRGKRKGWTIAYEDWSMDEIETFRKRGARYFITAYTYGLQHKPKLFQALDNRFRKMEQTSKWVFYDLGQ